MNHKFAIVALMTTALAVTPLAPANAYGHHSHGGRDAGLLFGLFAAGIAGTAIALATVPQTVIAEPPPSRVYVAPAPVYYNYEPIYRYRPYPLHQQVMPYGAPYPYAYPAYYSYR